MPYTELNAVLGDFMERVQRRLDGNFVGAYRQGSFAVGDFDEDSDVDRLIVVGHEIVDDDLPALQALHAAIVDLPSRWAQRLEGSYVPAAILRRWSESPRDPAGATARPATWADPGTGGTPPRVYPFLFLGNGARAFVRSEHDNTRVVRWVTREKATVLAGPDPRDLIDEVSADALREEVCRLSRVAAQRFADPSNLQPRWVQAFLVVLYCRMLHTPATGTVTSKKAATA
jgi:predicted nucleotidyltransferase